MERRTKRLTAVLIAGLVIAAAGVFLYLAFRHHHQICIAPYGAAITNSHPAPSRGNCSTVDSLFYLGIGAFVLGGVVSLGAVAAKSRQR